MSEKELVSPADVLRTVNNLRRAELLRWSQRGYVGTMFPGADGRRFFKYSDEDVRLLEEVVELVREGVAPGRAFGRASKKTGLSEGESRAIVNWAGKAFERFQGKASMDRETGTRNIWELAAVALEEKNEKTRRILIEMIGQQVARAVDDVLSEMKSDGFGTPSREDAIDVYLTASMMEFRRWLVGELEKGAEKPPRSVFEVFGQLAEEISAAARQTRA